jgi:hypothetical protein
MQDRLPPTWFDKHGALLIPLLLIAIIVFMVVADARCGT